MNKIELIRDLLAGKMSPGPADEETIRAAEEKLGVRFPPSYREFLSEYGAVCGEGYYIAGLFPQDDEDGPPLWEDVVEGTLCFRRPPAPIPKARIPISCDGVDCNFYLDTSRHDEAGECPVIALGPGVDDVVIADDFYDFVVKLVNRTLSY